VRDEDSYKFENQDENIAVMRNGKRLSIEGRKPITVNDTIPIVTWRLSEAEYVLKATIYKFDDRVKSYLQDAYLATTEILKNDDVTFIPFSITADSASFAGDRFRIIFETYSTLPVIFSSVKAQAKNKGVHVEWTVESESNMEKYEIERSSDTQTFTTRGTVTAIINRVNTSLYSWFDASPIDGNSYYRIKSSNKSGEIRYSEVVKIEKADVAEHIAVSIKSGQANSLHVVFKNTIRGDYLLSLIDPAGQKVFEGRVHHSGGTATRTLTLNRPLPTGIYSLRVANQNRSQTLLVLAP
jgi:hypothetical protein